MKKESCIQDFFAGRNIFITGATGFMGKVLIEKLLRSCPDITNIYLLMRPKKGAEIDDRLKNLLTNKLFDKIRTERPSSFEKLVPVVGNTAAEGLGLLPADRQTLIDKVSIVFHVAANVRFDISLKDAIFTNTRSVRDMCILASNMKNLAVLVHVSTAFCQIDKHVVDEILYPVDVDWRRAIEIAESVDEEILKILTMKYIESMPNTYLFTKKLAEQVISDYSKSLPCVVLRPSIVTSTMDEPFPGWVDNFNGPIGIQLACMTGVLRVLYADPAAGSDWVPVDYAITLMLMTAWIRGTKTLLDDQTVHVCNCTAYIKKLTTSELTQLGLELSREIPLERLIWSPHTMIISHRWIYYILMLLLHVLPAICIDGVLKLYGAKPMLLKLQRNVYVVNSALSHIVLNKWSFRNIKYMENIMNSVDLKNKNFAMNLVDVDIREYYKNALIGAKVYLLNEDMNNLEVLKKKRKRMDMFHNIVKTIFVITILWILYNKIALPTNVFPSIFYISI